MSIFSRHYAMDYLPASWKPVRFSEGLSCVFLFFFGRKVGQMFSLSLPWTLFLHGERVALNPGGWPQPLAALSSVSLSVSKASEFASTKGELSLEAVEAQGGKPTDFGRGVGQKSPLFWGSPSVVTATCPAGLRSLALLHWVLVSPDLWLVAQVVIYKAVIYDFVSLLSGFCSPELRFVWFSTGCVWNQFSNLYSYWVELEYPHWNFSGTQHSPHTVARSFHGLGAYWFYKVQCDLYPNLTSVLGHSELTPFSEICTWLVDPEKNVQCSLWENRSPFEVGGLKWGYGWIKFHMDTMVRAFKPGTKNFCGPLSL